MFNKGSQFADFVRFRPYSYTHTYQSLPPFWAAIKTKILPDFQIYISVPLSNRLMRELLMRYCTIFK